MSFRPQFVAYRLEHDGQLVPIKPEELPNNFVPVNILAIYVIKNKRLYIWVGDNASRTLRNMIATIEGIVLKNHPLFTILRHFIIEGFKAETEELLDLTKISTADYKKRMTDFDTLKQDLTQKMEIAKRNMDEAFNAEKFDEAITEANKVLDYSEKLFDNATRSATEKFIQKIMEKSNRSREMRITNKVKELAKQFKELDESNQFDAAKQKLSEIQAVVVGSQDRGLLS